MIMTNGPALDEFDFDSAARVFIGSKARRLIHVPSLSTSAAQERARASMAYGWDTKAAECAFAEQLPIAQAVADLPTEDITQRLIGSNYAQQTQKKKTVKKKERK